MLNLELGYGQLNEFDFRGNPSQEPSSSHGAQMGADIQETSPNASLTIDDMPTEDLNSTDPFSEPDPLNQDAMPMDDTSTGSSGSDSAQGETTDSPGSSVPFDTLEVVPTEQVGAEVVKLDSAPGLLHEFVQPGIIEPARPGWGRVLMNTGIKGDIASLPLQDQRTVIATLDQATREEMAILSPNNPYRTPNYADIIGVSIQTPHAHWADMPAVTSGSSVYKPVDLHRGLAAKFMTVKDYWTTLEDILIHPEQVGDQPPSMNNSCIVPLVSDAQAGILRPTIYGSLDGKISMERINYFGDMDIPHSIETGEMAQYSEERAKHIYVPITEFIYPDTLKELQKTAPKVYSQKHWLNVNGLKIAIQNGADKYPELRQIPNLSEIESSSPLMRAIKKTGIPDDRMWEIIEGIDVDTEAEAFRLHTKRPEPIQAYARALTRASEEARVKVK